MDLGKPCIFTDDQKALLSIECYQKGKHNEHVTD